jgi:hypothetical protein
MTTATTANILAFDLGKLKGVACAFIGDLFDAEVAKRTLAAVYQRRGVLKVPDECRRG